MWLFCKHGFFSAVRHKRNQDCIHLRARFNGDLERLFLAHGINAEVTETPMNDYRYRADIPRQTWSRIVAAEADAIDYTNFKKAVHDGTIRDASYLLVWDVMSNVQSHALHGA